ncbi:MAG: ubiquinone/menaquinone biosynthesis C-methylase UbiE [Candidatus Azotimanducaceae bacterium]|jgi:ubiquinone/menaquinone biosynthesis C-methylase UbiE
MAQSNLKQHSPRRKHDVIHPVLQRKLDNKLEEAGSLYDQSTQPACNDQQRISRFRNRAKSLAHKVLSRQPDNVTALNLLGRISLDEGDSAQAESFIDLGLDYEPDDISLNYSRAHLYLLAGNYPLAATLFSAVETRAPHTTRALPSLAYTRVKQGFFVEAFADYRDLIRLDPTDPQVRCKLFECISHIQADYYSPELEQDLLGYLQFTEVDHNLLSDLIATLLIHKYDLLRGNSPLDPRKLAQDPLLNLALRQCQFNQAVIEEFLTACRHSLLMDAVADDHIETDMLEFILSLSLQCANNEFVYSVTLIENQTLDQLTKVVSDAVNTVGWHAETLEFPLMLLSMYGLLHHYPFRTQLLRRSAESWSPPMRHIIKPHLFEPQQELEICRNIASLSEIDNPVSRQVAEQYEENPYPRWRSLAFANTTDYGQALMAELKGFTPPSFLQNQTIKILIAGCGTGKHALQVAQSFRNVEVTAIDLSRASLAYATKMARQLKIQNVEFYQADILAMQDFKDRFHIIECSGVLHHMQDPLQGWHALTRLLEPGGMMKISLYSSRARRPVELARQLISENQLTASAEHIRIFRQALFDNLISGDFSEIKRSPDFYNLSGCRDLLFHVQEHQFTPLNIDACVKALDLEFLGFVNLPPGIREAYSSAHADDTQQTSLSNWDDFESQQPALFQNMLQFYCQLKGSGIAQIKAR